MTRNILFLVLLLSSAGLILSRTQGAEKGSEALKLLLNSKFKYAVVLPKKYKKTKKYPLVVALHGMGNTANNFGQF